MTKLIFGAVGLALVGGLGCVHLQPVGPITNPAGTVPSPPPVRATEATDVPRPPAVTPLPPPPPPAVFVTPGEVTETNHPDKVRRLLDELEADRKAMEAMPRASEVSIVRR